MGVLLLLVVVLSAILLLLLGASLGGHGGRISTAHAQQEIGPAYCRSEAKYDFLPQNVLDAIACEVRQRLQMDQSKEKRPGGEKRRARRNDAQMHSNSNSKGGKRGKAKTAKSKRTKETKEKKD